MKNYFPGRFVAVSAALKFLPFAFCLLIFDFPILAQGPSPETGATLFPGGALISYNSVFTTRIASAPAAPSERRPTLTHEAPLTFMWGFRRDYQLTVVVPVVTHHLGRSEGGTGVGDTLVLLKYRFLRRDSPRGTTQAAVTAGPTLPTGRTGLRDVAGTFLPVHAQPGSGAAGLFLNLSGTYTGLFRVKRLVADESVTYVRRGEGAQQTRLGDFWESRFWLSYRPYQSKSVGAEWWVGPSLTWQHMGRDRRAGLREAASGGDVLWLGATTYYSPRAGLIFWLGAEVPPAQDLHGIPYRLGRRVSFGVTRQFTLRR